MISLLGHQAEISIIDASCTGYLSKTRTQTVIQEILSPSLYQTDGEDNDRVEPSMTLFFGTDIPSSQYTAQPAAQRSFKALFE